MTPRALQPARQEPLDGSKACSTLPHVGIHPLAGRLQRTRGGKLTAASAAASPELRAP